MQTTLAIVKPDAVAAANAGAILARIEQEGLRFGALRMMHLSKGQAEGFYYVHRERPFFSDLTDFMSEGPICVIVLKGEDAITRWRTLMGATNPEEADEGTLRKQFGTNIERNSVHGSDSPESAAFEIGYFFSGLDQVG